MDKVREALAVLLERYTSLVNSGDCGNWDVEAEPEVIAARAALAQPQGAGAETRLFIDCEFNGAGGELISMALVGEDGREFYEVVQIPKQPQQWVAQNVLPILNKQPIGTDEFKERLREFLAETRNPLIISDWPVDIAYLCEWVIVGDYPLCNAPTIHAMSLSLPDSPASAIPHNALEDARAIAKGFSRTHPEPAGDEREDFIKWASKGYDVRSSILPNAFADERTHHMWLAWLARANLRKGAG